MSLFSIECIFREFFFVKFNYSFYRGSLLVFWISLDRENVLSFYLFTFFVCTSTRFFLHWISLEIEILSKLLSLRKLLLPYDMGILVNFNIPLMERVTFQGFQGLGRGGFYFFLFFHLLLAKCRFRGIWSRLKKQASFHSVCRLKNFFWSFELMLRSSKGQINCSLYYFFSSIKTFFLQIYKSLIKTYILNLFNTFSFFFWIKL